MRPENSLTPNQAMVLKLDREGYKPTKIAELSGISIAQVGNLKKWLREHGYELHNYRGKEPRRPIVADDEPALEVAKSPLEPEDDEQPDADEPAFTDIDRCHCGLILPCYHEPASAFKRTSSIWDSLESPEDVVEASVERRRKSDRKCKTAKPTTATTA